MIQKKQVNTKIKHFTHQTFYPTNNIQKKHKKQAFYPPDIVPNHQLTLPTDVPYLIHEPVRPNMSWNQRFALSLAPAGDLT